MRELPAASAIVADNPPVWPLLALLGGWVGFRLELQGWVLWRDSAVWADLAQWPSAMVRRALAGLRDADVQAWVDARRADGAPAGAPPVSVTAVRAAARSATAAEARVLAHLVGGTTRTVLRAHRHGSPCTVACPACDAEDTVLYRMLVCPAGGPPLHPPDGTGWTPHGLLR